MKIPDRHGVLGTICYWLPLSLSLGILHIFFNAFSWTEDHPSHYQVIHSDDSLPDGLRTWVSSFLWFTNPHS
jgi:hypothetical protein